MRWPKLHYVLSTGSISRKQIPAAKEKKKHLLLAAQLFLFLVCSVRIFGSSVIFLPPSIPAIVNVTEA